MCRQLLGYDLWHYDLVELLEQTAEDVAGALELFRMNYELRKERNGPLEKLG